MKRLILLAIVLQFPLWILAQQLPVNVSYFGENGLHPGLKIGIEKSLIDKEKTKERWINSRNNKLGPKTKIRSLVISPNIGFYNHANNHAGLFINGEIFYRRVKTKRGFYWDAGISLGYLQRIYNIPTYELGSNTEPYEYGIAGQAQFMPSGFLAFGQNLLYKRDIGLGWFVKPQIMLLMPYGHTSVLNPAMEIGVKYLWNRAN